MRDVLVRAQELGGKWVSIGSDASRGIVVEDLSCGVDEAGPREASFVLRRRTDVPWPDIGAFAPIEIESQNLLLWSGRVKGTPTTDDADRRISVNAEGWQYHLDDDSYQKIYVDTKLANWVDSRTSPGAPLGAGAFCSAAQISNQGGAILMSLPKGYVATLNDTIGIGYTAGPNSTLRALSLTVRTSNNFGGNTIMRFYTSPDNVNVTLVFALFLDAGAPPAVGAGPLLIDLASLAAGTRFLGIQLQVLSAFTLTADSWIQISSMNVFGRTADDSAGLSVLKASSVVQDAVDSATLLLSPDRSLISPTTFSIPDFTLSGPTTPREVINAANVYHQYQARVNADRRFEYRALPSKPTVQVDARSSFDEASAGDASEIYSSASVGYTGPDGFPGMVQRSQQSSIFNLSSLQPTNPSATVDTSSWTAAFGTLTRTIVGGEFSTAPGGFKLACLINTGGVASTSAWSGSFIAGNAYRLVFDVRCDTAGAWGLTVSVGGQLMGVSGGVGTGSFVNGITLDWVQPSTTAPIITVLGAPGFVAFNLYFDNLLLYESQPTIVNRRGFRRTLVLDTNMSLTPVGAQQIADVALAAHRTTPLKGKVVVTGYGSARRNPSGAAMTPAELLLCGGDLLRIAHLIDPDTGALGREGRIASVSWDQASDAATVELDSQSQNFEAMLARLALVTGQVPA